MSARISSKSNLKPLSKASLPKGNNDALSLVRSWFSQQGWTPWPFQEEAWAAYRSGRSGLIHIPTGAGKTYASYMGPLSEWIENPQEGLQILYITPLRALSRDIELALKAPVMDLGLPLVVESRTGDTTASQRNRQRKKMPHVLITTPESLSLLLSYENARERFSTLKAVIIDEWHDLLSSKRGIQIELAMARLRQWSPVLRTWALSATIANLEEAAKAAVGLELKPVIVSSMIQRPIIIDTLIPDNVDSFPWAGHLGSQMMGQLLNVLDINVSTLIFTNVRSHAERWFQELLEARPEWAGLIALHHGSLDRKEREFVEAGLKDGSIKIVVCTSSLDLGVDFAPVERVFQIGSPKGVARLIQRAGRAAHRPGAACRITCVPTQALELLEIAAVRQAVAQGEIEARVPLDKPYDVLAQHLVTCAMGGGFFSDAFFDEIQQTLAYQDLSREEFDWLINLVRQGGKTLWAYPEYHKVVQDEAGQNLVTSSQVTRLHRFNIGTILSDSSIQVILIKGKKLGTVEESFIAKLNRGDVFTFAGRQLEFVMVRDMVAYVRLAKNKKSNIPRWDGGRLPFTHSLGTAVRNILQTHRNPDKGSDIPEIEAAKPILQAQQCISKIPRANELLLELFKSREGYHLFMFPFEGRFVHEGLAAVLALRFARFQKNSFQVSVNDYGIEFLSQEPFPYEEYITPELFTHENLFNDILESMNLSELAKRQFREIARVAGLVYQNYPGASKTGRQLQASSSIIYEVFQKLDPDNLFLNQSRREVLEKQFEEVRLVQTMKRLKQSSLLIVPVKRPSPLAFPLLVERIGTKFHLSNESLLDRITKMKKQWTQ